MGNCEGVMIVNFNKLLNDGAENEESCSGLVVVFASAMNFSLQPVNLAPLERYGVNTSNLYDT